MDETERYQVTTGIFTETDIGRIEAEGLTPEQVLAQLELFEKGAAPVTLRRPCTAGDGIVILSAEERDGFVALYDRWVQKGTVEKFVPASGAASRMFAVWRRRIEDGAAGEDAAAFAGNLRKMAFFGDLREAVAGRGADLDDLLKNHRLPEVLAYILTAQGMNYGDLPKALLKFHLYPGGSRTALEEHLVEAALYARDGRSVCRIHFTVSRDHEKRIEDFVSRIRDDYEKTHGVTLDIRFSTQSGSTNTIAVDGANRPARDKEGALMFRPGGHGALLENLQNSAGEIVFLKNIDNVVPDRLKPLTVLYKKALAGYLLTLRDEIFRYLKLLAGAERATEQFLAEMAAFGGEKLNVAFPAGFADYPPAAKRDFLFDRFNRPLRVCGMVRNEGEPGGAPFWVERDGLLSIQIIEAFQVDGDAEAQQTIWSAATHFNPVDLVCALRDYRSRKFDLGRFADREAFSISWKNEKGREVKALELPGLWNGSMAFWNSVFVEVPPETFNPVKTIDDLLRPQHLPAGD